MHSPKKFEERSAAVVTIPRDNKHRAPRPKLDGVDVRTLGLCQQTLPITLRTDSEQLYFGNRANPTMPVKNASQAKQ
jgi:hypothetical protein